MLGLLYAGCDKVTEVPVEMSISTSSITFPDAGGEQSFTIISNTKSWAVSSNASSWLTIAPASGSKDGTVTLTAPANSGASERTAIITVKGTGVEDKTITVKQPAIQNLSVSTTSLSFSASAEQKPFTITSNAAWTITSNQSWCTVQPVSGNGNREITVSVLANPELSSRKAILTITADTLSRQVTIEQAAANPNLSVSTSTMNFVADGGQQAFTITSNTSWTISSNSPTWLTVSPSSGSNNGAVTVTSSANTGLNPRTASISVNASDETAHTISVTQAGITPILTVSTNSMSFPSSGQQQTFTISSNTDWTISSNAPTWLTVSPVYGSNNGTISVSAVVNSEVTPRTATITINGTGVTAQTINITQVGASLSLTLSTTTLNFTSTGGQQSFNITSNTTWTVSSNAPSWLTVSPASGSNNSAITVLASTNTDPSPRTATVTVFGNGVTPQTISITQTSNVSSSSSEFYDGIVAAESFGGGNGTQGNPFLINNAQQLKKLVNNALMGDYYYANNTYFKLTTDIHVTATEWIPIGVEGFQFGANFDGNGHTISGILKSSNYHYFGFFGFIINDVRISNLTISATIRNEGNNFNNEATGAIAGICGNGIIRNCHITGTVTGGGSTSNSNTGGVIGIGAGIIIQDCDVSNNITGGKAIRTNTPSISRTGGIVGLTYSPGEILNCNVFASASIIGGEADITYTGGIAGANVNGINSIISNCLNSASVIGSGITGGNSYSGGIVGQNTGSILFCTNNGSISNISLAQKYSGGLVGENINFSSVVHTSLNTGNVSGQIVGGLAAYNYSESHIYSCNTNRGMVNGQAANENNQIGSGKAVESCPDGHVKR